MVKFLKSRLNEHAALFYLPLAIQLHNDESPKCKKLAWLAIKSLLEKVAYFFYYLKAFKFKF
jgi:hypothetical protein